MKSKITAGLTAAIMVFGIHSGSCVAGNDISYVPQTVFQEEFSGKDGDDLALSSANKADNYFSDGFYFINNAKLDDSKTNRFAIKTENISGINVNTIKRLDGVSARMVQSIYKPLKSSINMNPTEKTVYYIKWSEYIQDQSPDGKERYGGFKEMSDTVGSVNDVSACMLDLNARRAGAGIGKKGTMRAFVSADIAVAPVFASESLKENTWYDMILKIEANPDGTNDVMSVKAYESGTKASGDYGASISYASNAEYGKVGYHFKTDYSVRTSASNSNYISDTAMSSNKGECFTGDAAEAVTNAEKSVLLFESMPSAKTKADALDAVTEISKDSIIYSLLSDRISSVDFSGIYIYADKDSLSENESDNINVSLSNFSDTAYENAVVAAAQYDYDGCMISVDVTDNVVLLPQQTLKFPVIVSEGANDLKVICLENMSDIKPLAVSLHLER